MIKVFRYSHGDKKVWDNLSDVSKNSSFLFARDYIEYHSDRFFDHSVLVFKNDRPVALFPAHEVKDSIQSHAGLTYGGLAVRKDLVFPDVISCFYHLMKYYHEKNYPTVLYKPIPYFYHKNYSFEYEYPLFLMNARLVRRDIGFVVELKKMNQFQKRRQRSIQKALRQRIKIMESKDYKTFWEDILTPHLKEKFKVKPTHAYPEIKALSEKFPNNIKLYLAIGQTNILAGAVIYQQDKVAHSQYISSNAQGRRAGAVDLMFSVLLSEYYKDYDYFSLGNVCENEGKEINLGLMEWKQGWGAWAYPLDFYLISTKEYKRLEKFIC